MQFQLASLFAVLVGAAGVVVVSIYFRKAHKARDARFESRKEYGLHEIFESHFAECGVNEDSFVELWRELAEILEIPAGRLLPSDRFRVELSPSKGFEFNDQINDVMYVLSKRCQRIGIELGSIESVQDYIVTFGRRYTK